MRSFYHYMMRYRGSGPRTDERRLADWMFEAHDFPKQSTSYDEVSRYLEWNIPFTEATQVFDRLWEDYLMNES
ncbi:YozE family protein [Sediminibacillus dalangtanensis]|uniref:YozE family protein n=1 Tax=Sediminibacillus dalangtanensis TaxID=2729421 RepID=A0ABX7VYY2_9BACI|nr:YozE family protein [Sediminibacillus dalangtanensis]QTM99597.1 YozE family protein [Sediminibacillus dalangtanensis]